MIETALDRVGIVMMSAIGDAVHVLPVVTALKRHRPSSHISWVLQSGPASLVRGHPDVDEVIVFDKKRGAVGLVEAARTLSARNLDLLIDLQVYIKAGLLTGLAKAPVKLGFDRARARDMNWLFTTHQIPAHPPQHVQDQYLEFLAALGVPHEPVTWKLGPWEGERDWQRRFFARFGKPVAAIVLATTHPQKDWPPGRWAQVIDVLHDEYGMDVVLCGGRSPKEAEFERVIFEKAHYRPVSTLGVPLRELVAVLDHAALVISPDTAPLHMAVALGRPVISLMGYNNPKRVGPYRRFHDLLIDAYGDPGEDYPVSIAHRLDRMPRITVNHVIEKVEHWRRHYQGRTR